MLKDLKPERVEAFLCRLADKGSSARTVNIYLQSVNCLLYTSDAADE